MHTLLLNLITKVSFISPTEHCVCRFVFVLFSSFFTIHIYISLFFKTVMPTRYKLIFVNMIMFFLLSFLFSHSHFLFSFAETCITVKLSNVDCIQMKSNCALSVLFNDTTQNVLNHQPLFVIVETN